nr:hypothetical protein [Tanacetum cinerariifolium]
MIKKKKRMIEVLQEKKTMVFFFADEELRCTSSSADMGRLKREYHSIRQTDTETSTELMQHFLRLVGFLGAAAGTADEQDDIEHLNWYKTPQTK